MKTAPMQHRPAHIALFIRSLYGGGGGGAERMVVKLASGMAAAGHRVDLILGRAEGPYLSQIPESVRCIDLRARAGYHAVPRLLAHPALLRALSPVAYGLRAHWPIGAVPGLASYLRRETPDALFSALNYSNLAAILAREVAGTRTRLVISERNTLSQVVRQIPKRRNRVLPELVRTLYPRADRIAAVSQGVATDLAAHLGIDATQIAVPYNPLVDAESQSLAREPAPHPWLSEAQRQPSDSAPVLLAAGKFKAQKGFDTLLRAFAAVRARREARLILLGEGPLRAELEQLRAALDLEAEVDLPGYTSNPFAYMARASLFVSSSRFEGLPGVLVQAMSCGCPVVATDCESGPREILCDGELGTLVPVDDPDALGSAMLAALAAPVDAARLRARANDFAAAPVVERHLSLLLGTPDRHAPVAPG